MGRGRCGGTFVASGLPAPLADDLEQVAVEQVAFWYQKRAQLGIRISWLSGNTYQ